MALIGGGHNFMASILSRSSQLKTIFVAKIHRNPSDILKVMTLCVNWHSWRVKG